MKCNPDDLVAFQMYRENDESGVSGTGVVAYGMKWPEPNGKVTLAWVASHDRTSVAVYDSMEDMKNIHGHGGSTKFVQLWRMDTGKP
jgi:hypothetical protein